ncbi:protein of unknown function [Candidatus Hydrogenisulfobacillus filiaventi]|uniref:Uncharacterized protein n=1 Tax=Candidatus Hydrogenisulfobacillus filiaventi TaxID=2707344 RepID=A0A6F8ZH80_9FIRM|nr:protein of unknown function [Candidatus Hydrogenisulfobacillus filiaventi]
MSAIPPERSPGGRICAAWPGQAAALAGLWGLAAMGRLAGWWHFTWAAWTGAGVTLALSAALAWGLCRRR